MVFLLLSNMFCPIQLQTGYLYKYFKSWIRLRFKKAAGSGSALRKTAGSGSAISCYLQ